MFDVKAKFVLNFAEKKLQPLLFLFERQDQPRREISLRFDFKVKSKKRKYILKSKAKKEMYPWREASQNGITSLVVFVQNCNSDFMPGYQTLIYPIGNSIALSNQDDSSHKANSQIYDMKMFVFFLSFFFLGGGGGAGTKFYIIKCKQLIKWP